MYNKYLEIFIQVADTGSFSKAAEKLYISSTAVMKQMNLMEQELGLDLLIRTNHGIKLTEVGKQIYKDCKFIIDYSNKAIKNDDMFANRADYTKHECRLGDAIKYISNNDVYVIDIAKLPEDKQAFVFGDTVRTIYNLKLGEYDNDNKVNPPSRIIVFIDELNKYASKDTPKSSPILREILDVTERGRSLGVVLFAAEQFRSNIHQRITGNCSTHAYGRTNSIETATKDYSSLPSTYKNMLTRLKQGDYLIQNPIFRSLLKIRFPKPIYKQFKK